MPMLALVSAFEDISVSLRCGLHKRYTSCFSSLLEYLQSASLIYELWVGAEFSFSWGRSRWLLCHQDNYVTQWF